MTQTVAVTGGSGKLGRAAVAALIEDDWAVVNDRASTRTAAGRMNPGLITAVVTQLATHSPRQARGDPGLRDVEAIVRARVRWPRRRAARVGRAATGAKRSAATKHLPARARAGRESPNRPASRSSEHLHRDPRQRTPRSHHADRRPRRGRRTTGRSSAEMLTQRSVWKFMLERVQR